MNNNRLEKKSSRIIEPFDPTTIDVDVSTVNLGSVIDMLRYDEINLQPEFQRSSDVWNKKQKSRLIESILLGLPLPSFFFSENPDEPRLSIIDGLQRLCAIKDFVLEMHNPLVLKGLQFLTDFEGMTYADLKRPEQRRIDAMKITINVLRRTTPDNVKYIIFQRVNTAGTRLVAQEIRNALNQGEASRFVRQLSREQEFLRATGGKIGSKRMADCDFVNRFIAFYNGYEEYTGDLDEFLNRQMGNLNKMTPARREEIRQAFLSSMKCCADIFGEDAFRKGNDRKSPVSKSIFDTLSVNLALLTDNQRAELSRRPKLLTQGMKGLFSDEGFLKSLSYGTGQWKNVALRFSLVKEMLSKILNS